MVVAIVLAGGSGVRFGETTPKQFIEVCGKPVIIYTLERINNHLEIDEIIVPCIPEYIEQLHAFAETFKITKLKNIIPGGTTFQESMKACVYALRDRCSLDDIILMHMSISPMVSNDILADSIATCKAYGNGYSAHPSYLCICEKNGENYSDKFLDRDLVFGLNTPQTHHYGKLLEIYEKAEKDNFDINSEPHLSSIMFAYGEKLYFSKSSPLNIKITTQDDMRLFEALLIQREMSGKLC